MLSVLLKVSLNILLMVLLSVLLSVLVSRFPEGEFYSAPAFNLWHRGILTQKIYTHKE